MGPMRFTKKTTRLVGDETWSLVNYLNNHPENIHQARKQLKLVPYIFNSENEFFYFNGRKIFASNSQMNDPLGFGDSENGGTGTGVPDSYTARPFWEWSDLVVQPFLKRMDTNVTLAYSFLKKYDTHSMRSFLATFDAQKLLDEMGLLTEDYQSPIDPRTGSRLDREYPQMGNIIIWLEMTKTNLFWKCFKVGVKIRRKVLNNVCSVFHIKLRVGLYSYSYGLQIFTKFINLIELIINLINMWRPYV